MARSSKGTKHQPLTTAQRLSSIVKSCRDIFVAPKGSTNYVVANAGIGSETR